MTQALIRLFATAGVVAVVVITMAVLSSSNANAQPSIKLKPGAWENTTTSAGIDIAALQEQLAKLPPQMRESFAKNIPTGPQTSTAKRCVTADEGDFVKSMQSRMNAKVQCETLNSRSSGSTYSWSSRCTGTVGPQSTPMKSESEHQLTMAGDTYQHKMTMKNQSGEAAAIKRETTTTGRFLGADCKAFGALTMAEQIEEISAKSADRAARRAPGSSGNAGAATASGAAK